MKEKASSQSEAVWAFLHGELTDEERSAFERDLQADDSLRRMCDDAARVDRLLRGTLPVLDRADAVIDDIADQALACWERENDRSAGLRSRWQQIFVHPAFGVATLAAAAVILLVSPVLRTSDGLTWDDPVFTALALRGAAAPAEQGVLSTDTARRCQRLLQTELERALSERTEGGLPGTMIASFKMRELRDGAFSLTVEIRTRKGGNVGEWSGDYSGEEAFREQLEASAAAMAEALVSQANAMQEGAR